MPKTPKRPMPPAGDTSGDDHEEDLLDEALDESFPASDPPSFNPGVTGAGDAGKKKPTRH